MHDFADGLNVVTLAFAGGRSRNAALVLLAIDAAAPVLGIAISQLVVVEARTLGLLLGLFGGAFIVLPFVWIWRPRREPKMDPRTNGHTSRDAGTFTGD